jgi:hypothetical protein
MKFKRYMQSHLLKPTLVGFFVIIAMLCLVSPAAGDDGDVAIYWESTGLDEYTSTTPVDVDWDTNERQDSNYSRSGATITLTDTGHYLVNWALTGDEYSGSGGRAKLEGLLDLDGADLAYGRGWGTLRATAESRESYAQGSAIIDVDSASEGSSCRCSGRIAIQPTRGGSAEPPVRASPF